MNAIKIEGDAPKKEKKPAVDKINGTRPRCRKNRGFIDDECPGSEVFDSSVIPGVAEGFKNKFKKISSSRL